MSALCSGNKKSSKCDFGNEINVIGKGLTLVMSTRNAEKVCLEYFGQEIQQMSVLGNEDKESSKSLPWVVGTRNPTNV